MYIFLSPLNGIPLFPVMRSFLSAVLLVLMTTEQDRMQLMLALVVKALACMIHLHVFFSFFHISQVLEVTSLNRK